MRKNRGYFTVYEETSYDVSMDDVIENLDQFSDSDIEELKNSIGLDITKSSNLEDEQKIKILKEFFYKYSWEELEKIKKSLQ